MNNEKKDCVPGTVYPTQISLKFEDRIKPFFFLDMQGIKKHTSQRPFLRLLLLKEVFLSSKNKIRTKI